MRDHDPDRSDETNVHEMCEGDRLADENNRLRRDLAAAEADLKSLAGVQNRQASASAELHFANGSLRAALAAKTTECKRLRKDRDEAIEAWDHHYQLVKQRDAALAAKTTECERLREACADAFDYIVSKSDPHKGYDSPITRKLSAALAAPSAGAGPSPILGVLEALREAGGKAWDDVADPEAFLGRKPEPASPCPPRHYTADELGRDLGEIERQIEREGGNGG